MNDLNEKRALEINGLVKTFKSGDMETVIIKSKELIKKYPNSATIFNLFALANKNTGNFKIAIDLYMELLINNPENPMFLTNLANIYKDQGNWAKAEEYLKKALNTPNNTENTYISLGNLYSQQNRSDECIEFFEKLLINNSIKEDKNISELYFNLAESYRKKGSSFYDKAIEYYNLSNQPMTNTYGLECIYKAKDKKVFYKELEKISLEEELNPLLASIQTHASIRYDLPDNNLFCQSPFEYIYHSKLTAEEGFDTDLIKDINSFSRSLDFMPQELLYNGNQSAGNIFSSNEPYIQKMKDIILSRIDNYRENFKDSNNGFIKKWPSNFKIQGWIIDIKKGGNLKSHMHKLGWLSGSLYLNIPKKEDPSEGNIVFSLHGADYPHDDKIFPSKEVDINKNDIVLFPSSIFHHTLPFNSEENRVTLAFDVKPKY